MVYKLWLELTTTWDNYILFKQMNDFEFWNDRKMFRKEILYYENPNIIKSNELMNTFNVKKITKFVKIY